jgi:molybdenum cofactor synthesis domain-containing protein
LTTQIAETAAVLLIGNELLSGKVHEANLIELARTLRALGVRLQRVVMLPDDIETLAREVRELSAQHDIVFTSGGVGPTHDDVTMEAIAHAFDTKVKLDPTLAGLIRQSYGVNCTESHLRMALVPEGATLASGPEAEWPTPVMRNVWILPGVPEIFRSKLMIVRACVRGPLPFISRAVFTKLEEATIKPLIDQVVERHVDVEIGSYPKWFEPTYRTKITFDARDAALVDKAVADFVQILPANGLVRVE